MKVIHSILSFSPSIAISQAIVCILLAFSPAVYSKNINPRKAAKIAQRYVTLPQSQEVKANRKVSLKQLIHLIIYIMTPGEADL